MQRKMSGVMEGCIPFCTLSCAAVTFFFFAGPCAVSSFCCACFMLHIFSIAPVLSRARSRTLFLGICRM